jgi:DNA polymerase-3 subunit epsilon
MRLLGLDLETTGLDFDKDKIIEIGYVVKDWGNPRPLHIGCDYVTGKMPIGSYTGHGITQEILDLAGIFLSKAVSKLEATIDLFRPDYIVAHNGEAFDKPFLMGKLVLEEVPSLRAIPWLDTKEDVPYPEHFVSRRLGHLAMEYEFLNPFPHAALFDVMTMFKVLEKQDLSKVIERSKSPSVVLRAMVSFQDKDQAKQRRYNWEKVGDKVYPKCWVKKVKECDLTSWTKLAGNNLVDPELGFPVIILDGVKDT